MKQLRTFKITFILLAILCTLASCSHDDGTETITTSPETQKVIKQGSLVISEQFVNYFLYLSPADEPWTASVDCGDDDGKDRWCQVDTEEGTDGWTIRITAEPNKGFELRYATLHLKSGARAFTVKICQQYTKQIRLQATHVDVKADGGDVFVIFKANVMPRLVMPENASWLKYVDCQQIQSRAVNNTPRLMAFHLKAERNTDWGRLATLILTADSVETVSVDVHQWCRALNKTESIHVPAPGQLAILLGGNALDWAKLNTLKLSGTLNATDMQALRTLLKPMVSFRETNAMGNISIASEVYLNLQHLDMKACTLTEGGSTYAEPTIASETEDYTPVTDGLGEKAFCVTRTPLQSIVLPEQLQSIGARAFYMCGNLERIEIPAGVKSIGDYAFSNCQRLQQIILPADSKLETLGMYALYTGTQLDEIHFPATLKVDERMGILGYVAAQHIYLKWSVPPVLKRFGVSPNTTLHVPAGTAAAYRNAEGWNRAKAITED